MVNSGFLLLSKLLSQGPLCFFTCLQQLSGKKSILLPDCNLNCCCINNGFVCAVTDDCVWVSVLDFYQSNAFIFACCVSPYFQVANISVQMVSAEDKLVKRILARKKHGKLKKKEKMLWNFQNQIILFTLILFVLGVVTWTLLWLFIGELLKAQASFKCC